jgi:hypothetical protein
MPIVGSKLKPSIYIFCTSNLLIMHLALISKGGGWGGGGGGVASNLFINSSVSGACKKEKELSNGDNYL